LPRYDYECEDGHVFELKQSFSSEPKADCPVCGKPSTRQFSVVPIVFKGSGWYVNDYGKKGSSSTSSSGNDGTESDSSRSDGSGSGDGAKAEKPAKGESSSSGSSGDSSKAKASTKSSD